jgi:hypothetical protein
MALLSAAETGSGGEFSLCCAPACDVSKLQALKTLHRSHDFLHATLVPSNADLSSF